MQTQGFIFSNVSTQVGVLISEIYLYKKYKGGKIINWGVTDKHCGKKSDIKELQV